MGLRFFVTEEVVRYRAIGSVEVSESRVLLGFRNFYEGVDGPPTSRQSR